MSYLVLAKSKIVLFVLCVALIFSYGSFVSLINAKEVGTKEKENFKLLEKELDRKNNNVNIEEKKEVQSWGWQIAKTSIFLFVLIAFFWLFLKLRSFRERLKNQDSSSLIRVLYEKVIHTGKILQLVEFNSSILLLAVSDSGIQLISEIKEKSEMDRIKLECSEYEAKEGGDFLEALTKTLKDKFRNNMKESSMFGSNTEVVKRQKDELESWDQLRLNSKNSLKKMKDLKNNLRN